MTNILYLLKNVNNIYFYLCRYCDNFTVILYTAAKNDINL